jgi:hypothetical protein
MLVYIPWPQGRFESLSRRFEGVVACSEGQIWRKAYDLQGTMEGEEPRSRCLAYPVYPVYAGRLLFGDSLELARVEAHLDLGEDKKQLLTAVKRQIHQRSGERSSGISQQKARV